MTTVNVAKLKASLSHYLRRVAAGDRVLIVSHNHPVATLSPYAAGDDLAVRPPADDALPLRDIKGNRPKHPCDPLVFLEQDRSRR
jgi:prevent-host-death family protein